MKRNLIWYTGYYFLSLVLMRGCGLFSKILLARTITPYEYGLITLFVLTLPGALQFVTGFCFFDILGHAREGKKYFGFTLIYGFVSIVILAVILFLFPSPFFTFLNIPSNYWSLLSLILIGVLFAVTFNSAIFGLLRGVRNHALAANFSTAPSLLRVIFIFLAIFFLGITDPYLILVIFALPAIIVLIFVVVLKRKTIAKSLQSINVPTKNMMLFGFSFFILSSWFGLSQQINSIIISHDLGITWQGYYDVSLSMVAIIGFFPAALYEISAPETTANNSRTDVFIIPGGFGDIGRFIFSICLLCVLVLFFYAHQLTLLLFTDNYEIAADYLVILAIGYTVLFIQQFNTFLRISAFREKMLIAISLLTVVCIGIFPFFTHFMIIYFNFLGVYLATTIFIIMYTLGSILIINDLSLVKLLFLKIDRLILTFTVTFIIVYLLKLSLIPGLIIASFSFIFLIIATGYIEKNTLLSLIPIKNKYP